MGEWDVVEKAWDVGSEECATCQFKCAEYYSDTGYDTWCLLLQDGGLATQCTAYERIVEEEEMI